MSEKIDVRVFKMFEDVPTPVFARGGDACFDLCAYIPPEEREYPVLIAPGETKLVHTGIKMAVPQGYELQVRPRSGMSLKTSLRIANSPGTIDSGYRGEICVVATNQKASMDEFLNCLFSTVNNTSSVNSDTKNMLVDVFGFAVARHERNNVLKIEHGKAVCQVALRKCYDPHFILEEVWDDNETTRGAGGFGHTDKT